MLRSTQEKYITRIYCHKASSLLWDVSSQELANAGCLSPGRCPSNMGSPPAWFQIWRECNFTPKCPFIFHASFLPSSVPTLICTQRTRDRKPWKQTALCSSEWETQHLGLRKAKAVVLLRTFFMGDFVVFVAKE